MKWVSRGGAEFLVTQRTALCNGYHLTSAVKDVFVGELTWSLCPWKNKKKTRSALTILSVNWKIKIVGTSKSYCKD